MSNVSLSIGGRSFTVACAAGEEAHVAKLGRSIDAKLTAMGDMAGQSESRMLLFASLLLADELHETQTARTEAPPPPPPAPVVEPMPANLGARLLAIATRLENLADLLEG